MNYRLTTPGWHRCLIPVPGGGAWKDQWLEPGIEGELKQKRTSAKLAIIQVGGMYVYVDRWDEWERARKRKHTCRRN